MKGWGSTLGPPMPLQLRATAPVPARRMPADWAQQAGEYVGAWAAGSMLGYVVSQNDGIAFRTGLATSSVRNLGDVVIHRNDYPIWYLVLLGLTGSASIIYVWRRGGKP